MKLISSLKKENSGLQKQLAVASEAAASAASVAAAPPGFEQQQQGTWQDVPPPVSDRRSSFGEEFFEARPALPRSWANLQAPSPESNAPFRMLNHQRELTLPRLIAAPTATSSAYF